MKSLLVGLVFILSGFFAKSQHDSVINSAYFGLDNALPNMINLICPGGMGQDGMPVNFRYPIDRTSLSPNDFEVIDSLGNIHTPLCAVLAPANENGENRSVLLIGEFGNADSSRPVEVRVIGDLLTIAQSTEESACSEVINLNGASTTNVVPLASGPLLFFAQKIDGSIDECSGTTQTIQVAWDGGVVPFNTTDDEIDLYQYYRGYTDSAGILVEHIPVSLADLNDNDNFHQLCFETSEQIIKVSMQANTVEDPNQDPNDYSEIEVSYCENNPNTGLENQAEISGFSVFPNPAYNQIEIVVEPSFKGSFEVYDLLGNFLLFSYSNTISLAQVPSGTYLLVKKNVDGSSETLRFLKF